jgi:hypothetical protein
MIAAAPEPGSEPWPAGVRWTGLALLVLGCIGASQVSFGTLVHQLHEPPPSPDVLRRLDRVRDHLAGRQVVGLLSDDQVLQASAPPFTRDEPYLQYARYCLAPITVQESTAPELVVGIFQEVEAEPEIRRHGLRVRIDLGGGVMLLEHPE